MAVPRATSSGARSIRSSMFRTKTPRTVASSRYWSRSRAFTTYVAYGGPFKIHGDTVQHHVETSLFPNWVGTVQQRRWEVDETGERLTLSSPPVMLGGVARIHRLTWERTRD